MSCAVQRQERTAWARARAVCVGMCGDSVPTSSHMPGRSRVGASLPFPTSKRKAVTRRRRRQTASWEQLLRTKRLGVAVLILVGSSLLSGSHQGVIFVPGMEGWKVLQGQPWDKQSLTVSSLRLVWPSVPLGEMKPDINTARLYPISLQFAAHAQSWHCKDSL